MVVTVLWLVLAAWMITTHATGLLFTEFAKFLALILLTWKILSGSWTL